MQSINLSYARYEFYKERKIIIDEKTYWKLFIGQASFKKNYNLTNKELI